MNFRRNINIIAVITGVVLGPSSLSAANASQPPLTWSAIAFIVFGCLFAGLFVIGLQILRKNKKYGYYTLRFFEPISIFMLGSGIGASVYSVVKEELGPSSVLFIAVGLGLFLSVAVSSAFFKVRHRSAL